MRAALLIQRWYRQYVARLEMRRRCTWNIFQSIEYSGQQDHIKLYNFFGYLMDHFSSANSRRKNEVSQDTEWERRFCYKHTEVPDVYTGPHLSFPLSISNVTELVHAFRNKQVQLFLSKQLHLHVTKSVNKSVVSLSHLSGEAVGVCVFTVFTITRLTHF
uniref:Serine/threonine-protein phosphatase with EF-hands 2-like n=1 Tax=Sinocyclocheilus anshuiensis TaxID=1608454 RepID=A0A671RHE6_9TELE